MRYALLCMAAAAWAQPPDFGPPGFPGGPGGFPGMEERKILKDFDKDGDGKLNAKERAAARASLAQQPQFGRGRGRGFGPGAMDAGPVSPGPKLTSDQVKHYSNEPLFDLTTLRTIFLEFENSDWEKELAAFHHTDVEVPCKLTVDGKVYPDVGVHFRGNTSFMMVPEGRKRSFGVSLDFTNKDQRLLGVRSLNLMNAAQDPSFLRIVLYSQVMNAYTHAPRANFVRVVINGESWGIYVNQEQFNSDFLRDHLHTTKGARWKTPGSPRGGAGLSYLGDDPASYKRSYEIKSKDDPKSWAALINVCKVLNTTPPDKLEAALSPILDIEGTLRFLAVEKALGNNDGYWTRASDYNLFLDASGKFHICPHDMNETLTTAEGPGMRGGRFGGPGGGWEAGGADRQLDPFAGADDPSKPLLNKLLAVPALRQRYLALVQQVAREWLDWKKIEPLARQYQALIRADIKSDNRKLFTTEAFESSLDGAGAAGGGGPFGGRIPSLKSYVEARQAYLLSYPGGSARN